MKKEKTSMQNFIFEQESEWNKEAGVHRREK